MKEIAKVVGINLGVLLLYSGIWYFACTTSDAGGEGSFLYLMGMLFFVGGHVLVDFIVCIAMFATERKAYGLAFLLAAVVVLVLGFSACMGGGSLLAQAYSSQFM